MQAIIGNSLVKVLEPDNKPYEVRDTQLKGLILRVQPSGVKTYYCQYARGKRVKLGRADAIAPAQAREAARQVLAKTYTGGDPMAERQRERAHTFATFVDEVYKPWAEANIRTSVKTVARLRGGLPDLQDKKLAEISPWLVEKWRTARLKGGARKSTVNRCLGDLKSALAKAVEWGLIDSHPLIGVKQLRIDVNPVPRFLSDAEQDRLTKALEAREERLRGGRESSNAWRQERGYAPLEDFRARAYANHLLPMVIISLNTGVRRGELFGLTWAEVRLEEGFITVRGGNSKSQQTRHVPLNDEAVACLAAWRRQASDLDGLVFPGRGGRRFDNVDRAWRRILAEAVIEKFRWHDLRHTFASNLVMAGVDLNTVREVLGHSDLQMTLRYAHLSPDHKAAAVARLGRPHDG
jgi:integrase